MAKLKKKKTINLSATLRVVRRAGKISKPTKKKKLVKKVAPKKVSKKKAVKKLVKKVVNKTKKVLKKKINKKIVEKILKKSRPKLGSRQKVGIKKVIKKVVRKVPAKPIRKIVKIVKKKVSPLELKRSVKNPIISPSNNLWESKATFNPTALLADGKVHLIYRAIGETDNSVLGYARSDDGLTVKDTFPRPIYYHFMHAKKGSGLSPILYSSGGGWGGGCEDPRVTLIDDTIYMTYTAFDGWGSVRMALTSISLKDFLDKCWNWKEPVLISPPGEIHKNWVLFPEKINGKYAILHSISPEIMIDYFNSLNELDGDNFIHSIHQSSPLWAKRDRLTRGVGPSPIKTKYGWLVVYHKMDKHETHRYKLWAMILDSKDPTKVLYNSPGPILEPDEWYENEGYKAGVVYACGAVVKDGKLFVYYGGADKISAVATADLDKFLTELIHHKVLPLQSRRIEK